ncbi:glutamate racemase [Pelomonas sp. SE-A7]|uniref:glutamate racemase n=1 Tax=Pelomonas sp. SE-A7 TaxID=3054953 RepID=UPI00259CA58D|nr:glutamate racemase [Pelomonas sp. SE-A7]MDM4767415.1 glutamate racemase [Pelomonas sp. SE-A7]
MTAAPVSPSIGVFDSGVGGLTVLRELHRQLPDVPLHYIADAAYAPYGERSPAFLAERSTRLTQRLLDQGARLIVIACNTATAHAIQALRERWPGLPIVGTEPGIKPAVAASSNGRVGVLATPATIASQRYRTLVHRHAGSAEVFSQPCPGLADLIERGNLQSPELAELIEQQCAPLREAGVDTVLMGCTHYPFVQTELQQALGPQVRLLNIETAVAQQARRLWEALSIAPAQGGLQLATTGDAATLTRFANQMLGWQVQAEAVVI